MPHHAPLWAIVKDEDREIRQWPTCHLAIGFERVPVYDNKSRVPLRTTLPDLVSTGLVTVIDWPLVRARRLSACAHALWRSGGESCAFSRGRKNSWLSRRPRWRPRCAAAKSRMWTYWRAIRRLRLRGGALEEALRMGRMLSRFRTGLDLSGANGRESP